MLRCSFCGKSQRAVKKLIAGPTVYICDECIGLCNQIIEDEQSLDSCRGPTASSARGLIARLVEREGEFTDHLADIGRRTGSALPETVRKALADLVGASEALRVELQSWSGESTDARQSPPVSLWLRPCLERLGGSGSARFAACARRAGIGRPAQGHRRRDQPGCRGPGIAPHGPPRRKAGIVSRLIDRRGPSRYLPAPT